MLLENRYKPTPSKLGLVYNNQRIAGVSALVVDEVTQHCPEILSDLMEVARLNKLQLFLTGDYRLDPPMIYQMGPVTRGDADPALTPRLIKERSEA